MFTIFFFFFFFRFDHYYWLALILAITHITITPLYVTLILLPLRFALILPLIWLRHYWLAACLFRHFWLRFTLSLSFSHCHYWYYVISHYGHYLISSWCHCLPLILIRCLISLLIILMPLPPLTPLRAADDAAIYNIADISSLFAAIDSYAICHLYWYACHCYALLFRHWRAYYYYAYACCIR